MNSGIFFGQVTHQRLGEIRHSFSYPMAMMLMDLDELPRLETISRLFGLSGFKPLKFNPSDYLRPQAGLPSMAKDEALAELKKRVLDKSRSLGAVGHVDRLLFAGQIRHFGFYFSPVNFFFLCEGELQRYLLAEVSNTPWNERHCYLVDLERARQQDATNDKVFHVSPFMSLDMRYRWQVALSPERLRLSIANEREGERLFRASLNLVGEPFTRSTINKFIKRFPVLTAYILYGIYRQALSLYRKGVTFVAHPGPVEK